MVISTIITINTITGSPPCDITVFGELFEVASHQ